MSLTPEEIRSQEFRKSFRGVDAAQVAEYLDRVAADMEHMLLDLAAEKDKVAEMEERLKEYQNIEKILQQTLLQAQETGTRAVENARREAELMLQQAEVKAAEMLDKARRDLTGIKEQITLLIAKKEYIINRLKQLLNSQLETMKSLEGDPEFSLPAAQAPAADSGKSEFDDILKNID